MSENGQYAIYKGIEYKCCFRSNGKIGLLSEIPVEGFIEFMGTYSRDVLREECSRVYKKTLCFKYNNDSFLIREEDKNRVLLETGPRSYDLISLGFERVLNDTFQKWMPVSEGEKYWAIYDYK
ncbi:hypothetical protein B0P06_003825 [Clostridium saccharoperbutylacetonicum]|uniref:Uncharacterized protein n=1 Tax=Clostridium saccharoperbutylacetonicum N1-4(HMT) TaxID=931276 RepID=M1LX90_9CLOT|nr:hypothetical protein [Clostridium saccharoperbutylacetonicum]AGF57865.1 hypothetical protein Cspa_c41120 [Clostridium saccharoperbutylacetonicum N1-4(HMT)]NRT61362.1 hypothetical protein [Clostridium saccharoperbutylacetonicum]NSB24680.1 hypothetical protein [Clostridium saccharoperbutylacetonicum]NSB44054.1 hypothetical protein [Clostridium saccharoperbutylacetonicum]